MDRGIGSGLGSLVFHLQGSVKTFSCENYVLLEKFPMLGRDDKRITKEPAAT